MTKKQEVILTNPDKIYWPEEKYTKKDVLTYYESVSEYILPFLKNRPMVLRRFPDGIEGTSFVQKDTKSLHLPDWIKVIEIEHTEKNISYFLIQDEPSMEYVVNLGSIELHPFHSHVGKLDYPDYFVLDIDPVDVPFNVVIESTNVIHKLFDSWKIPHYCKTSGGRGLHIYIPLHAHYTIDQVSHFGQAIATLIHEELPNITSLERSPAKRQNKIYLDVLQNRAKQTIVAPYALRGRPHAPVSTPIHWEELKKGLKPENFNIKTMDARLKEVGEIFSPILGKGFNMKQWIKDHIEG